MAHHGLDLPNIMLNDALINKFGATGLFPKGKIDRLDEGEIRFGIAADHKNNVILINFGKPVTWLGLTADEAIEISNSLRDKGLEIKTKSKH